LVALRDSERRAVTYFSRLARLASLLALFIPEA